MCVYMYLCVYMCIYMCVHKCVSIHMCIYICVYINVYIYIYLCQSRIIQLLSRFSPCSCGFDVLVPMAIRRMASAGFPVWRLAVLSQGSSDGLLLCCPWLELGNILHSYVRVSSVPHSHPPRAVTFGLSTQEPKDPNS